VYFLIGLTLICGVSFWDDISSLPNRVRIVVHFLSISLVFYGLGLFTLLPWWLIPIAYIFFVGVLNAYNFMDGINGITGLYSLSILIALQYVNYRLVAFTPPDFINFAALACLVFLFFNYREQAKCFAGDVGSMGISFWIVTLLLQLMLATESFIWIFFLAVYGVDTICTILHRIYLKQNIFEAHRLHFYQILSNEKGISHLKVSFLYAFLQLFICCIIIYSHNHAWEWAIGGFILLILLFTYLLKFRYIPKIRN
jgi:UDP-N-acetylmuramyl pentapeptide phosphotransferase/UDP-N-acetylglucosamine-1-phosphate transferase